MFEAIVERGYAWSALDREGDYLALAYANFDDRSSTWELGGLMVGTSERGRGYGSTLMRLALGHLLFEENPLELNHKVVAHVLKSNPDPRPIIEQCLKFEFSKVVKIPATSMPGLRANAAGVIEGDEFHLVVPDTLIALADWLESWDGKLKNKERVTVILRSNVSFDDWIAALRDMIK